MTDPAGKQQPPSLEGRLQAPFPASDVEWRIQQSGEKNGKPWARVLAYITNRAIQERLDQTVGAAHWRNDFETGPGGGVLCGISIRIDGEWITKWDGAENTNMEAVKGGLSGAMKRAAVQWGIGRYLYNLESGFANIHGGGKHYAAPRGQKPFKWDPPPLPAWALPVPDLRVVTTPEEDASIRHHESRERTEERERDEHWLITQLHEVEAIDDEDQIILWIHEHGQRIAMLEGGCKTQLWSALKAARGRINESRARGSFFTEADLRDLLRAAAKQGNET